jgi:hypothetical protein
MDDTTPQDNPWMPPGASGAPAPPPLAPPPLAPPSAPLSATGAQPFAAGPAWPGAETTYVAASAPSGRRARRWAAAIAALAVVGGGLATLTVVRSQRPATQTSPEAAVRQFIKSIEDRDILGAAEQLPSAERALIVDLLADVRDAKVPGSPSDGELRDSKAYTLKIDDLQTATRQVTDDIATVALTGGHYEATSKTRTLPFIGSFLGDVDVRKSEMTRTSGDLAEMDKPLELATVRDGNAWRVSLFYTAAEAIRVGAHKPPPVASARIAANGADSPESAVRQMVDAAAAGQWQRMIELTPPDEMAALHDYGALALADATAPPAQPFFTVSRLELDRKDARHATVLVPKAIAGSAVVDGRTSSLTVERTSEGCWHSLAQRAGEKPVEQTACATDGYKSANGKQIYTPEQLAEIERFNALIGVVTVQVDGKWYVSPSRTALRFLPAAIFGAGSAFGSLAGISPCLLPTPDPTVGPTIDDPVAPRC